MNRRPGQVNVTTEVGYCPSCGRTRNLRHEEHHLGALVRTIVTCETCHRTLSSAIGVATAEPVQAVEAATQPEPTITEAAAPPAKAPAARAASRPAAASAAVKEPAVKKAAVKKAAVKKKAAASAAARGGKPTSTATRKPTRRK
jgi:hypothetical protein